MHPGLNIISNYTALLAVMSLPYLTAPSSASAESSLEFEWDPYYSNAGYYIGLTDQPVPEVTEDDEAQIYERLLNRVFTKPRFMLLELSVNPLPLLGVYTKKHHQNFYDDAEIRGNVNLIQAFTEGYEEPYAVSLFFGSIVSYVKPGEQKKTANKGFIGYLLSYGSKHIINNTMIDDDWYEIEWKIKGDIDFDSKLLNWSLGFGGKIHDHPDITDIVYFSLKRSHFDSASNEISWFENADIDYKIELNNENFDLVQQSLFINKKWPTFFTRKSAFEFGVGFILEKNKYRGSLQKQAEDFRLILRPSFQF